MTAHPHPYRDDLLLALRLRDVPGPRIAEALAEVECHLSQSGEDPVEAFGPAGEYADRLCEAIGHDADETWTARDTRTAVVYGLGAAAGAWLALDGALSWLADHPSLGLPAGVTLSAGLVVLAVLGAGLVRVARHADPVRDPRDGRDMVPRRPWWVLPVMVTPVILVVAVLAAAWALAR
ncbi:MAG: hypothetical protein M3Y71_05970 [Actinomycetota bacterium]|nr:hypothetical protein [Actinomycetota bacterium]